MTVRSAFAAVVTALLSTCLVASPAIAADDWKSLSGGSYSFCAIRAQGRLYCWGVDGSGSMGNGPNTGSVTAPSRVGRESDWSMISIHYSHACGIRAGGLLYCWGGDLRGELGNGDATGNVTRPQRIGTKTDWTSVSTGFDHTCGIRIQKLYCWGSDDNGKLGNGDTGTGDVTSPRRVGADVGWQKVAAGASHTCGIREGKLFCWGLDDDGQLGNGPDGNATSPIQIGADQDWKRVATNEYHTCAVRAAGELNCWGDNAAGQVGNSGAPTDATAPVPISATDWGQVGAGYANTCAVNSGYLFCWGDDTYGQVGNGDTLGQLNSPTTPVDSNSDWTKVVVADRNVCALRARQLYCWGFNDYGSVGNGEQVGDIKSPLHITDP